MKIMQILHITPSSNGYEVVTLIANRVSRDNWLAAIEKDGLPYITGGFLINDTPEIRAILDGMPKEKQYDFVKSFKTDPFAKSYQYEN